MAGDWLKVEITTPEKPEVSNIAHRLGITPEEAFGRLFLVWVWCQNVSANGHVRVRDLSPVDRAAGMTGFGQAMAEECWIETAPGGFIIPKWDRHLSKGAKKRALDSERKQRERHGDVRDSSASKADKSATREEKRRGSLLTKRTGARKRATQTPLPIDFGLTERVIDWAKAKGYAHLQQHLDAFRVKCEAHNYRYANWESAFMEAVRADWAGMRKGVNGTQPAAHSTVKANQAIQDGARAKQAAAPMPEGFMLKVAR